MSAWLKNAVIYQIFIDRFAGYNPKADDQQPNFVGGNIKAIIGKLAYLEDLGVDAIWLTPFFKTTDYHGYSTLDFYQIDERFGTLADLKDLVAACHKAGIRVIIDFTANHTSVQHPFFQDALEDTKSQYRQWYYFEHNNHYLGFLGFNSLPKLNLDYRPARDHVIGAAEYWTREVDIDGMRLDHVVGPSDDFWREFRDRIKAIKPDMSLIGEAVFWNVKWSHFKTLKVPYPYYYWVQSHLLGSMHTPMMKHYVGIFDGCLDYTFKRLLDRFATRDLNEKDFRKLLQHHYDQFPADFYLPSFLDNHDSNRYLYNVSNDYQRLKQAVELQFSLPQPKIIYYGDEVGMTHEHRVYINSGWAGDLPARKKMNWQPNEKEQELLAYYKDLIKRTR